MKKNIDAAIDEASRTLDSLRLVKEQFPDVVETDGRLFSDSVTASNATCVLDINTSHTSRIVWGVQVGSLVVCGIDANEFAAHVKRTETVSRLLSVPCAKSAMLASQNEQTWAMFLLTLEDPESRVREQAARIEQLEKQAKDLETRLEAMHEAASQIAGRCICGAA